MKVMMLDPPMEVEPEDLLPSFTPEMYPGGDSPPLVSIDLPRRRDRQPSMVASALQFARRGWLVLPVHTVTGQACSCGDLGCDRPGKHPQYDATLLPHGVKNAITDALTIRRWWKQWPSANIGIATGAKSGLLVLDVDPAHGGETSLSKLVKEHGPLPKTVQARSGRGGSHWYFRHPGEHVVISNSAGKFGPGLDIRGDDGYIIAPPSLHHTGARYRWITSPDDEAVAGLPPWLGTLLSRSLTPLRPERPLVEGSMVADHQRNDTLTSLAGTMRRRGMSEAAIVAALLVENSGWPSPLLESEVERIAKSIASYPPAPAVPRSLTDLGNAQRLVDRHGHDLRYSGQTGWFAWDERRWARDETEQVVRYAKETVRSIYGEAEAAQDPGLRKALAEHAQRSEAESKIRAMIRSAQSEAAVVTTPKHLDTNPWLLNVTNGTLHLSTGQLHPHKRDDLITKLAPVEYVPDATSPWWDKFLTRVVPDADVRAFLQRASGYSLTGLTDAEVLFMIHGPGGTGKTTFLEAIKAVLGDYAVSADSDTFLKKMGDRGIPNDIARLAGARFVSSVEVDHGKRLAESLVKRMTGGDTVPARFLYKEHFEFTPQFKLWIAANFRPQVTAHDSALWRRIILIPFRMTISEQAQNPEVKRRLREERDVRSAILAWAVRGCLEWEKTRKLQVPEVIRTYTREYRRENDVFQRWLDERAVLKAGAVTGAGELRRSHEEWVQANGLEPVPAQEWGQRLRSAGCKDGKANKGTNRVWRGIGLK